MKEPARLRGPTNSVTPLKYIKSGGGLKGFASMKEEVGLLEKNLLGIEHVYIVDDTLKRSGKGAMCANGAWFYVWEYAPDESVYFVSAGEPDIFNEYGRWNHIKIGKLAYANDGKSLGLLITLSQDAVEILLLLGNIYESADLSWTPYE